MTGSSLWNDRQGTLYHFNGLEAGDGWGNLALVLRTSGDGGTTWSPSRLINPEHRRRNQVISHAIRTKGGAIIQGLQHGLERPRRHGRSYQLRWWPDLGRSWRGHPAAEVRGGTVRRHKWPDHAGLVELGDGRLRALGRDDNIDGQMPLDLFSSDGGKTWTYSASPFTPISGGQRLVLARLHEGPLLLCSFTDPFRRQTTQGHDDLRCLGHPTHGVRAVRRAVGRRGPNVARTPPDQR